MVGQGSVSIVPGALCDRAKASWALAESLSEYLDRLDVIVLATDNTAHRYLVMW
jgi:hypothetical protein